MIYHGHVKYGQIALDEAVRLPEGARVDVEVKVQAAQISRPKRRVKLQNFEPIEMPGGSMADEIVHGRR
jgi:hypothetical protein